MNKKELCSYETDASRLIGSSIRVAFPKSAKEVQNLIKTSDLDIVPRGAGTNFVGGCVPKNSLIIDLNKMNRVLNFNPQGEVYVEAGASLYELNEKLSAVGFEFPIQPLNQGVSTIGGMIATNASDNKEMKYGRMKDWIEYIEFVNGRGELMKTTRTDLMDVCGMEGITGIIIGARLRVIPKIKRTMSIFQTDEIEEVLSISKRLKLEKDICSLDLFSPKISKILGFPEKYNLFVEFDSDRGKIKDESYEEIKNIKENVYYFLIKEGYLNSEDPKLFFDKLKEFILYLESNQIPYFSHIGSGIVVPFFKEDEHEKRKDVLEIMKKMNSKLGKYGRGITRKDFVDDFEKKLLHRVKLRNDPFGKMNKGKIIDFDSTKILPKNDSYEHSTKNLKKSIERNQEFLQTQKNVFSNQFYNKDNPKKINLPEDNQPEKKTSILNKINPKIKNKDYLNEKTFYNKKKNLKPDNFKIKKEINIEKHKPNILQDNKKTIINKNPNPDKFPKRDILIDKSSKLNEINKELEEDFKSDNKISKEEQDIINKVLGNRFKEEKK